MKKFFLTPWASTFDIYTLAVIYLVASEMDFWWGLVFIVPTTLAAMFVSVLLERTFLPDETKDRP